MIVGLTGGIGSGKTTIAQIFASQFAIPIYIADTASKQLIETNKDIRKQIVTLFGEKAFEQEKYNSKYIASIVFTDAQKLQQLNAIIHPAVQRDFQHWVAKQSAQYVIKESAILFESGSYRDCDLIISVVAPVNVRIERVMLRDKIDKEMIEKRIKNQWTDAERVKYSNFVIENREICKNLDKVREIHFKILKILEKTH